MKMMMWLRQPPIRGGDADADRFKEDVDDNDDDDDDAVRVGFDYAGVDGEVPTANDKPTTLLNGHGDATVLWRFKW